MSSWRRAQETRQILRVLGDTAAAWAALGGAFLIRIYVPVPFTEGLLPSDRLVFLARDWIPVLLVQLASLYFFGFYDPPRPRTRSEVARRLAAATVAQILVLTSFYFLFERSFPRSVLLLYVVLDVLLVFAGRSVIDRTELRERRVALVGSGEAAREIAAALRSHAWHGLRVAGYVPLPHEAVVPKLPLPDPLPHEGEGAAPGAADEDPVLGPCLGTPEDLPELLAAGIFEDLILADSGDSWQTRLVDRLAGTRPDHTNVLLLPGPFESLIGRMRYRWVHDLPLIEVVRESEWRINRPLKRLLDLAGGSVLLLLSLPVLGLSALAVKLSSPGPVFYRQVRVGRGQKPFTLWKLRTMQVDAEPEAVEVLAQPGDPRLTRTGALLRGFRLDEIPQLLNVLDGSMSLVGPRPERPGFVQRYLKEVPGYAERFSLAPGLTGLAQVNGDYHSSPQNKLRYELAYMANWTLWLDLSILLRTVKIVLTSRGV